MRAPPTLLLALALTALGCASDASLGSYSNAVTGALWLTFDDAAGTVTVATPYGYVEIDAPDRLPETTLRPVLDLNDAEAVAGWLVDNGHRFDYVAEMYA